MGLLDDAIREHLELKRLHGADAGEVARQEHEALGPVRREDIAIPDTDLGADGAEPSGRAPEAHGPVADAVAPMAAEPAPPAPVAPKPAPAVPEEEPGQATVAFSLEDVHAAEAAAARSALEVPVVEPVADAPVTPPVAEPQPVAPDVVPADEEPGEHDELEETPEFLQETPEHDRLWFEQKPPRDFDF